MLQSSSEEEVRLLEMEILLLVDYEGTVISSVEQDFSNCDVSVVVD